MESPGQNEVLIRLRSSGICGSDLVRYKSPQPDFDESVGWDKNNRPGHEPCGEVVELGQGVTQVSIGDRVMQHHYDGCRRCDFCRSGWQQLCTVTEKKRYYGGSRHGGHGDFMTAHESTCIKMPDDVSFQEGAYLACGATTAYQALKRLNVSGRDVIAVFGQVPVGLAGTMFASYMGARVIAVDINKDRLDWARLAGAWTTVDNSDGNAVEQICEITNGEGADASLEAAGQSVTRIAAVDSLRPFGRGCFVGEGGEVTFSPSPQIIHKQITLIGSWTFSTIGLSESANFVANKKIPLGKLVSNAVSIEDTPAAYQSFSSGESGKFLISWS